MMKKLLIIILGLVFFSCSNQTKVPEYVIPKDDMIDIILDIHLTDGLFTISKIRKEITSADSLNYYDEVFRNYGYTRADFDTSVYYYSKNINEYDKIYEEVLNRLNEMDTELRKENKGEKEKKEELIDN